MNRAANHPQMGTVLTAISTKEGPVAAARAHMRTRGAIATDTDRIEAARLAADLIVERLSQLSPGWHHYSDSQGGVFSDGEGFPVHDLRHGGTQPMTRITPSSVVDLGLEDDAVYQGVLTSAKFAKSTKTDYPDQVIVEWELRQGVKLRDYIGLSLGLQTATKQPSKLRQLLNALAEKPKDAEVWFDADTMEWGYDLDAEDSTPAYAKLTPGMAVMFKGENRKGGDGNMRYKVTGYKQPGAKLPLRRAKPVAAAEPVDVDPSEIPF